MTIPELILFGPQSPQPDLAKLRESLQGNSDLKFLIDTIEELPHLWPIIQKSCPDLKRIPGAEQLKQLSSFLDRGTFPNEKPLRNILLAPLTVICQVVEFVQRDQEAENISIPAIFPAKAGLVNVQGFCIGFLAAAVVACSLSRNEFEQLSSVAVRLAVLIGSVVDLDEGLFLDPLAHNSSISIRWATESEHRFLEEELKKCSKAYISCVTDKNRVTVTILSADASKFSLRLSEYGLLVQSTGLHGRFHHPTHLEALQSMKDICKQNKCFQLPTAERLTLALRSGSDAQLINEGFLHDIALDSILSEQSQWFQTVKAAIMALNCQKIRVKAIGGRGIVPPSVVSEPGSDYITSEVMNGSIHTNYEASLAFPNGIDNGQTLPDHQPQHLTQQEQSDLKIKDLTDYGSGIAVIGMACRFPEADSLEQFWKLIASGGCAVQQVPKDRFNTSELCRDPKGPFWGNFLADPDTFDHQFFGISSREAKAMDPQQRLLLQIAYETMESSGYCGIRSIQPGSEVGCYIGVGAVDYGDNVASHDATAFSATGTLRAFISGKVSHYFGWSGPSITYDTACSSSAVAIHSACKALQAKECSMALAGGVNVMTSPSLFQNLSAAAFLSPTGASKAFDVSADGYCRGEGGGLVLLKPLARAISDKDSILGVILGSAINQGSNCTSITEPDSHSQSALYQKILSKSGTNPADVSYVEAHGTGTSVGDPIEYESIRRTFGGTYRAQELFLGSVKDNIGHTEAASGVAALLKTILMMRNRIIPKQANFISLNPRIPVLEQDRMTIAKKTQPWTSQKLIAMINNYGAAGSNAAILLREFSLYTEDTNKPDSHSAYSEQREFPFFISARSPESLRMYCAALRSFIATSQQDRVNVSLADIAFNLACRQNRTLEHVWTYTASDLVTLSSKLDDAATRLGGSREKPRHKLPIVLCFAGQTGKTISISQDLFNSCTILRDHLIKCDSICQTLGFRSFFPQIFQTEPVENIVSLHCMLFSVQYACAKSWLDCGLEVDTLIGHSFGQLTALCVAGSLSLVDGLRLISSRAQLIQDQWGAESGIMLSVEGDRQDVEDLLVRAREKQNPCYIEIACFNGPRNFVLAADKASIEVFEEMSKSNEVLNHLKVSRLKNTHAFHSRMADNILPGLTKTAESLQIKTPLIRIETSSQGQSWPKINAERITQHTRLPVYFSDAVERVAGRLKSSIWLEAGSGSGSSVVAMVRRILKEDSTMQHIFQPVDIGSPNTQKNLAKASCELWAAGSRSHFWLFHPSQQQSYTWTNLPPYQFEKTRHWMQYKSPKTIHSTISNVSLPTKTELLRRLEHYSIDSGEFLFSVGSMNETFELYTRGHAVSHQSLCPASMFFELATRAARDVVDASSLGKVPHVQEVSISSPLGLNHARSIFLRLCNVGTKDETWRFSIFSSSQQDMKHSTIHVEGTITLLSVNDPATKSRFRSLERLVGQSRCEQIVNSPVANGLMGPMVYKAFGRVVNYASYYRGVQKVFARDHEVVGLVSIPHDQSLNLDSGCCCPIAIDNFLQVAGIHVNCLSDCKEDEIFICTAIGELLFLEQFLSRQVNKTTWRVYSNFETSPENGVTNDIFVLDSNTGDLMLILMRVHFTKISLKSLKKSLSQTNGHKSHVNEIEQSKSNVNHSKQDVYLQNVKASERDNATKTKQVRLDAIDDVKNEAQLLDEVRNMLVEVMEIPAREIQPESALHALGVDSLMITEVLSEIKKRFNMQISMAEFQSLSDLNSLCCRIQPSSAIQRPEKQNHTVSNHNQRDGFTTIAHDCFTKSRKNFDLFAKEAGFLGFCQEVYSIQLDLVVMYVVKAFATLGCCLDALSPGQCLPEIEYISIHKKLVGQLYKILENAHLIKQYQKTENFYRTETPIQQIDANVLQATLVESFPKYASEHQLLHKMGQKLADCITGRTDPLALLFGNAEARKLLEDVYTNAPMFKSGTMFLSRFLVDILQHLDHGREIQILELGAGTGGTSNYLIDSLMRCKQKFRYTFTDISSSMVAAAKRKFARYTFMEYSVLDVENPPSQFSGQYDIIISTNCIHATRNLSQTCTNIKRMLHQDGILCLTELTQNLFWFDLVFGLLEGWWLFEDSREHALADKHLWNQSLRQAGFQWVDWTESESQESQILRVIAASPLRLSLPTNIRPSTGPGISQVNKETVVYEQENGIQLLADIYYPEKVNAHHTTIPVALMIHGGGHVMLSRKDIRPRQTQMLLKAGFLPISIDYRLCPETSLLEGPMYDVCNALRWVRITLPKLVLQRDDIHVDGKQVVAVGWSTGGHLAMTLAWTSLRNGIEPPQAVLSFYSPTDYEDKFWTRPNVPNGSETAMVECKYDIWEGVQSTPITAYNVSRANCTSGGWMAPENARSRIALHMNWKGQTVPMLLNGMKRTPQNITSQNNIKFPTPTWEQITLISPFAQILLGSYKTPTFLIHGTSDDLIPWQQSQKTYKALLQNGVEAKLSIIPDAVHLFDIYHSLKEDDAASQAVMNGYRFLCAHVGLGQNSIEQVNQF